MNVAEYEAMYRLEDRLWWYVGMRRVAERVLDGRLERAPQGRTATKRILDAGCGTGGNLRWLEAFGSVYGIDLSAHAIDFCRQRGLQTVARGSVTALPYADRSFDLITSFDVIYHLGVEDDLAALREMHRVLRPGGHLLVRVPAIPQLTSHHDAAVHTRQRYTLGELREKTERAGFEVLRASYANTLLFPLAAIARLLARAAPGSPESRVPSPESTVHSEPGTRLQADRDSERSSDVRPVPGVLNACLKAILDLEAVLLARVDLPLGLSALVVGRRPPQRVPGPESRVSGQQSTRDSGLGTRDSDR